MLTTAALQPSVMQNTAAAGLGEAMARSRRDLDELEGGEAILDVEKVRRPAVGKLQR